MLTTVESSTTMSWARATVTSVHQRREGAGLATEAGNWLVASGEFCDMRDSIYETWQFRIY
jgi:hypothetical protein